MKTTPLHAGAAAAPPQASRLHHRQELSAAPHPKEPATAKLPQEKQTGPGDLQTYFKTFSNPIALLLVLLVEKKSEGTDPHTRRCNWASPASSSLAHY